MKMVIDANYFEHEDLRNYLRSSRENIAVLIDYAGMEMRKGDALRNVSRSLSILCQFPKQVLVLKGTREVAGLRMATQGLDKRLIDKTQTRDFAQFCAQTHRAVNGDKLLLAALEDSTRTAKDHFDAMQKGMEQMEVVVAGYATRFTQKELSELRTGRAYGPELDARIAEHVFELWATVRQSHPDVKRAANVEEAVNNIVFRYTAAGYVWLLEKLRSGVSIENVLSPKKVTSDFIDIVYVAYATYFDGILSKETRVQRNYEQTLAMLKNNVPNAYFSRRRHP
ncbi:hypothetical protein [Cupriavidus nantongensis]|uniref:Uncharacterized protein n=1 Tax=Cupriavidus nantongensis TaxID=1796606 RepID=A0A142JIP0_9BURK|nr:hypothetical protein [Cupriavidus nantongensis]AMR77952.1 hypothetical protein A2G96_09475 [Cupriavidus nantongensis]